MVTKMIPSLFGMDPHQLQAQRGAEEDAFAMQYAQMDPFQQATFNIHRGVGGLTKAVGGMMGAQDPELQKITMRKQMLQGVDLNDPESLKQAAQRLMQAGDYPAAQELMAKAQEMQKFALDANTARATAAAKMAEKLTTEQRNAAALADTVAERGSPEWTQAYNNQLTRLTTKGDSETSDIKNIKALVESQGLDPTKGDGAKMFADLLGKQLAKPDQKVVVEADGRVWLVNKATGKKETDLGKVVDRSTKVSVSSQIKLPADVNALASAWEKAIEPDSEMFNLARNAQGLINIAAQANNPSAWESARTQVAKAVGEGKLSNEDIQRTGVDPRLIGGLRDWLSKKTVGVPDPETQKALFMVASYLEKQAMTRMQTKQRQRIALTKQIDPKADTENIFPLPVGQTPNQKSNVVDFNSLN